MPAADGQRGRRQRLVFLIVALAALAAFVAVAVIVSRHAGGGLDGRILEWLLQHRTLPLIHAAQVFQWLGLWWVLAIITAVLVGVLWFTGRMVQAVYLGSTVVAAVALNVLLKVAFGREPPSRFAAINPSLYSFPSGHTMVGTAAAAALAVIAWPTRWRWPVLVAAALFSVTMAASRLYIGVHWPSDVAGGLALGVTTALVVRLLMPWPTAKEAAAAQAAEAPPEAAVAAQPARAKSPSPIDVVFIDWGNTLMVDNGMREGPMSDWEKVEAEAGAQVALRALRARYRIVVATNAEDSPAEDVRDALARVGLDVLVDDIVSSADVGDRKPHYAFYRAALLRCGAAGLPLDPGRAVMVGDGTTNDIAGARRAGLRTIWYNPTKRRFPDGVQRPDAEIRRLIDLPATVDRLAGVVPERRTRQERKEEAQALAAEEAERATAALRAETAAAEAAAWEAWAAEAGATGEAAAQARPAGDAAPQAGPATGADGQTAVVPPQAAGDVTPAPDAAAERPRAAD